MWLSVGRFPVNQQFVVVSINGHPLTQYITADRRIVTKYRPTFMFTWPVVGYPWASGWGGCNSWFSSRVRSLRPDRFDLGGRYQTALGCARGAMENEDEFQAALSRVTRWRRERTELFLEGNGAEIRLRPPLIAPPSHTPVIWRW